MKIQNCVISLQHIIYLEYTNLFYNIITVGHDYNLIYFILLTVIIIPFITILFCKH